MERYLSFITIGVLCLNAIAFMIATIIEIRKDEAKDNRQSRFEIRQEMYDDVREYLIKFIMYHKHYIENDDGIVIGSEYYHKGCKNALEGMLKYIDKIQGEEVHRHVRKK